MALWLIAVLVGLDQAIKLWTVRSLVPFERIELIDGWFRLTYLRNQGAAFGMLQNQQWFFVLTGVGMVAALGFYLLRNQHTLPKLFRKSAALLIAGAIGNLIDRLRYGYVVDMFDFYGLWRYVFNFADVCVVIGSLLLFLHLLRTPSGEKS